MSVQENRLAPGYRGHHTPPARNPSPIHPPGSDRMWKVLRLYANQDRPKEHIARVFRVAGQ